MIMLWMLEVVELFNNYEMVVNWLLSIEKLFLKDFFLKWLCINVNVDCLKKGYIFKVELIGKEEKLWYFFYFVNVRFDEGIIVNICFVFDVFVKFSEILLNYVIY